MRKRYSEDSDELSLGVFLVVLDGLPVDFDEAVAGLEVGSGGRSGSASGDEHTTLDELDAKS